MLIHGFYKYFHFISTIYCMLHRHTTQLVPKDPSQHPFPLLRLSLVQISLALALSVPIDPLSDLNHPLNCFSSTREGLSGETFHKGEKKWRKLYNSFRNVAVKTWRHTPSFHCFMQGDSKGSFVYMCYRHMY